MRGRFLSAYFLMFCHRRQFSELRAQNENTEFFVHDKVLVLHEQADEDSPNFV